MPEALRRLQEEHGNIMRLLDALKQQLAVFDTAK